MFIRMLSIILLSIILLQFPQIARAEKITLASLDYVPFSSPDLPENGFLAVIATEAFKRAGYDLEIVYVPWKRALTGSKAGNYDGILGAFRTPEREQYFYYSKAVSKLDNVFVYLGDGMTTTAVIKAAIVGVIRGSSLYGDLKENDFFSVTEVDSYEQGLKMVVGGRMKAMLIDRILFSYQMNNDDVLKKHAAQFAAISPPFSSNPLYILVSRKHPDGAKIVAAFNAAYVEMSEDGSIGLIMSRFGLRELSVPPEGS